MFPLSATDVAFAMAGIVQLVAGVVWALGAGFVADTRRSAAYWSAYATLSALSFFFLVGSFHGTTHDQVEWLRAIGNFSSIVASVALQRGIWVFTGTPNRYKSHLVILFVALVIGWVGQQPGTGPLRIGVNSALLTVLYMSMTRDVIRHVMQDQSSIGPALLGLPLFLGALGFGLRGLRAALLPNSVLTEMITDSVLNVGTSVVYVVLALAFHATLMALVVHRLVAELRRRSRHDSLTGLLNRRSMEEALAAQAQASAASGNTFSVLMIDLDHFKSINDAFGHAVGDMALKHASALLLGAIREEDRLARFGGEEFLVLLPGLAAEGASEIAERLRIALSSNPLLHGGIKIALSTSIGVANWTSPNEDLSRVLMRADLALYRAKQQGRDQVAVAAPERPMDTRVSANA
ncbi:MAG: GGDEF domain-containing protein [Burkholderiaceae bacterium]